MNTDQFEFDINDVSAYIISRTLADQPVSHGQAILVDMALKAIAHREDIKEDDLRVEYHDIGNLTGNDSSLTWWVELGTTIECIECDYPATEQTKFTTPLCPVHYREALAQAQADNENDDIALGQR